MAEQTRLERLKSYLETHPNEPLGLYGLALEYRGLGQLDEAVTLFYRLSQEHPEYVPTYLMAGNTLETLGRASEARDFYEKGITAARAAGNQHAAGELQGALDLLP